MLVTALWPPKSLSLRWSHHDSVLGKPSDAPTKNSTVRLEQTQSFCFVLFSQKACLCLWSTEAPSPMYTGLYFPQH